MRCVLSKRPSAERARLLAGAFERTPARFDPQLAFAFEAVGAGDRIGRFGRTGCGAAAGRSSEPTPVSACRRTLWSFPRKTLADKIGIIAE
jgi:hypothetical protein